MPKIYPNYPHGFTDEEIQDYIAECAQYIVAAKNHVNGIAMWTPLMQLGTLELQKRQTERQGVYTKLAMRLSVGVAVLALVISGLGLWVTYNAKQASTQWEERQIAILDTVKSGLGEIAPPVVDAIGDEAKLSRQQMADAITLVSKQQAELSQLRQRVKQLERK